MTIKIKKSDLDKLSKEDLAAMASQIYKIKEAQKHRTLEKYQETAHDKQILFHKQTKRIRYFLGGNRSGKSTGGVVEDLFWVTGRHPYRRVRTPCKGLIVVQDFENHCKNIIEPKFNEWSPVGAITKTERNQNGSLRKIFFSTGSVIDILSHDQDVKVFEGGDWDFAHFDEPPPQKIFNAVWRGLTDRGGSAWVTATPIVGPWMYQEVRKALDTEDSLRWAIEVDISDNAKNIGEGDLGLGLKRIEEFASVLTEDEKAARLHGRFLQMQGLIFKEWSRGHHLIPDFEWPTEWPIWESIDPHPSKPWAVSWMGLTPSGNKILIRSGLYEGTMDDIAQHILYQRTQIRTIGEKTPRLGRCLIDNAASVPLMQRSYTDPTARRLSVREELENLIGPRSGGPRIDVAPKNVAAKIDFFKRWLKIKEKEGKPYSEFYAFNIPENDHFMFEIENYVWDSKRGGILNGLKDVPRKEDDDILDTIMQVCLTLPKEGESKAPIRTRAGNSYKV